MYNASNLSKAFFCVSDGLRNSWDESIEEKSCFVKEISKRKNYVC